MCVINDPLGQTHSPNSRSHYFHVTFVIFCVRTDNTSENNDHYRLGGSLIMFHHSTAIACMLWLKAFFSFQS